MIRRKSYAFKPTWTLPPGEMIRERLKATQQTQAAVAVKLGISRQHFIGILKGMVAITPEMAVKLERVFKTPAEYWMNLEQSYRLYLVRNKRRPGLR